MSRRDRQPRQRLDPRSRREAILAAAAEVFARSGYTAATMTAIAARADASEALVYKYFTGKDQLYAEIVRLAIDDLLTRQSEALNALADGVPVRDRVRAATVVYLDHIAHHPAAWALPLQRPGSEPPLAARIRGHARRDYVGRLGSLLATRADRRHEYALWGYFGFLDSACVHWVEKGCPDDDRWPLIDAALGALEGALGDWAA
ncbi:TetR/AcrR family transcriptional regulator [Pseudofrankia sp. BMG5.37]|uniref:TetR/AcrR family transcriptional regulator n=1 Tax=Pseudofrankia sp. BMG5.37 TaxID=3050035 RepID=UPI002894DE38|nr:TetR/AcrR family transcriptional regulator [Pseudofrankia sp. BMG5.37]MDT3440162.1 TetR/AcrR family transcriptional regulator [Pseudofrankia sp. BMG5.37]